MAVKRPFSEPDKDSRSQYGLHIAMTGCRMLVPEPLTGGVAGEEARRTGR
jgi:hypothetical protein